MPKYPNPSGLQCSFCRKPQKEVDKIVAGPNVYICGDCIRLCLDIIKSVPAQKPVAWGQAQVPSPARIKAFLDQYVIGQDKAKRKIAVAVYNHYKRLEANEKARSQPGDVEIQKSNLLLIGSTGTGKTLLAQTLARFLDVPFAIADATALTEAGYVGEDVENIVLGLYQASDGNLERTQKGIVYIDEIDKLAKKFTSASTRDVSGEGVQQAILKILEGTVANVQTRGSRRLQSQETVQIDTTNILFICGGSFEGLSKIIEARVGRRNVGFLAEDLAVQGAEARGLHDVAIEDLEKFGLIPELIGRLPVVAVMDDLSQQDLNRILTEPKNSLVKQYQKLFKFEKVKLTFTEGALLAVAERAATRRSGARGLRTILESVMLEIMYELPSMENLKEVVINEEVIRGQAQPVLLPLNEPGVPA
jgi:ATP-dependent Clp protease ATP-binding subunit ClpX